MKQYLHNKNNMRAMSTHTERERDHSGICNKHQYISKSVGFFVFVLLGFHSTVVHLS